MRWPRPAWPRSPARVCSPRAAPRSRRQKPKQGGKIRVATQSASAADTLDPAKGALGTDYVRANMFYNGLTELDSHLGAKMALAESLETKDATVWIVKLRSGVQFHDGKVARARRRGLFADAPQGPGDGIEGQDARRSVQGSEGHRPERSHHHAGRRERRLAGDPGDIALPDHQGRHDRLQDGDWHGPVTRSRISRRACVRSA